MDHSTTTTPSHRHLASETVMRIEVSLSSRRSSVVVFNTTARLVTLGRGAWSSVAYGAPCIVLLRETTAQDSPFQVKFAIAELESGIAVWEEEITSKAEYTELQPGFHSFNLNGQTMAVQFADSSESASFIDSLQQYMAQKERIDQVLEDRRSSSASNKKSPKMERKLSKKKKKRARSGSDSSRRISKIDISQPCEFRHLSGITAGHTDVCQRELEGKIERHQRSASMGAISQKQTKQRTRLPDDMTDGKLYRSDLIPAGPSAAIEGGGGGGTEGKRQSQDSGSSISRGKFKFSSLRITKKKPLIQADDSPSHKDDLSISSPQRSLAPQLQGTTTSLSASMGEESFKSNITTGTTSPFHSENGSSPAINTVAVVGSSGELSPSRAPLSGWQEDRTSPKHQLSHQLMSDTNKPGVVQINGQSSNTSMGHPHMKSPQRVPLQPLSPQHHKFPSSNEGVYLPPKKMSVPNTYDTLEPLDNKSKPKTLLSPPGKIGAPSLISKMTPLHRPTVSEPPTELPVSNGSSRISLPTTSSSSHATSKSSSPIPPPLEYQVNNTTDKRSSLTSPTTENRISSDLDALTQELSKVLQDFDELIAPRSPFSIEATPSSSFVYQPPTTTSGKETMV